MTWSISEFLKRPENKFFIEIEKDWITDRFVTSYEKKIREIFGVFIYKLKLGFLRATGKIFKFFMVRVLTGP